MQKDFPSVSCGFALPRSLNCIKIVLFTKSFLLLHQIREVCPCIIAKIAKQKYEYFRTE